MLSRARGRRGMFPVRGDHAKKEKVSCLHGGIDGELKENWENAYRNYGQTSHWALDFVRLKRSGLAHIARAEADNKLMLFLMHGSVELHSPPVSITTAVLDIDEPRAHAILSSCSNNDKIDGWYLYTSMSTSPTWTLPCESSSCSRMPPPLRSQVWALPFLSQDQ